MSDADLRNADLSNRDARQMTPEERAELRRRYDHFIKHVLRSAPDSAPAKPAGRVKAWVPTKRAAPARF